MSNINFFIDEENKVFEKNENYIDTENEIDIDEQVALILTKEEYDIYSKEDNSINVEEMLVFYNNFNVKYLSQILQYYGIYKPKMIKNEMIQILVLFETQDENKDIILTRIRLWKNIEELKSHSFFGKYIMF
jgi:hypothetical protein